MTDNSQLQVYHKIRRQRISGSYFASTAFILSGLLSVMLGITCLVLASLIMGLGMIIAALILFAVSRLVEPKYKELDYCDACGNEIQPTSRTCPHCRAQILPEPLRWYQRTNIILGLILLLLVLGLVISALII